MTIDVKQFSSDKILSHIDRINGWLENKISKPITYELDMTNVCNNNCPFCFGFHKRKENAFSLSLEEAKDIVSQIKEFGGRALTLTGGGEPLCNPHTLEVLAYAKTLGLDVGFISNGLLLDEKVAEVLARDCTWVRISLDAGSKEVYKTTHGLDGDTFEKILKNIEILIRAKQKQKSKVTIGLGYLTPPPDLDDMRNFVLLSKKLAVDYAQFRPILKRFGEKRVEFDTKTTIDYIKELAEEYSDDRTQILFSKHKYEELSKGNIIRPYDRCYGHNFATVISADAKMYLCCHTRGIKRYCLGDLKKDSLQDIWVSEQRKKVCRNIDFDDCPYLCRCDSFNTVLWHIKREQTHKNFL